MFLLDTDHISVLQTRVQPEFGRLHQRIAQHPRTAFFVCIVSFHEQILGAHTYITRARTSAGVVDGYQLLDTLRIDYANAQVLLFDQAASAQFDQLRAQRVRVPTMDLRIAALALVHQFTVLTRNLGDFRQVPGLTAEDWTQ
jgi:tRNA(fMet)-specific endonuclease VapC